jgi:DNA-binding PadR family transcriptional regulator
MTKPKGLTELESCTLGLIARLQPCSTYRIRSEFARSSTTEWSASAGSIYPVIERLLDLRLIRAESRTGDARGRRDLRITRRGDHAVRAWLLELEPRFASATPDPIRTRAYFLEHLKSAADQRAFVTRARELTQSMIHALRRQTEAEAAPSEADHLAALGALFQLEARLRWLAVLRKPPGRSFVR